MASSRSHYLGGFLHLLLPNGEKKRTASHLTKHLVGFRRRQTGHWMPYAWALIVESSTETMILTNLGPGLDARSLKKSAASVPFDANVSSLLSNARIARAYGAEPTLGRDPASFEPPEVVVRRRLFKHSWT